MFMIGVEQNIVWTKCVTFDVCYVESSSSTAYNLSQHKHPVTSYSVTVGSQVGVPQDTGIPRDGMI